METDMTKTTTRKPAVRKTPVARKPAPVKATAKPAKKHKKEKKADGKVKVVRDSFTMPQADYDLIAALKQKALKAAIEEQHIGGVSFLQQDIIDLRNRGHIGEAFAGGRFDDQAQRCFVPNEASL